MEKIDRKQFRVKPDDVLKGALLEDFGSVVVIGQYRNGRLYVAGSDGTPKTFEMIDKAKPFVDSLVVQE